MMWWNKFIEPEPIITVDDMYKYANEHSTPLLSNFTPGSPLEDFWEQYRNNYAYFDQQFRIRYRSFCYFMQDYGSKTEDVQPDFTTAVYGLLLKNSKKYSELYRINNIDDLKYSLLDNYDMTETFEKDSSDGNTHISKQHTDTLGHAELAHTDSNTHTEQAHTDTTNHTKQAHTDTLTHTEAAFEDTDTTTTVYGQKVTTEDKDFGTGAQTNTETGEVSAYNESGYNDDARKTISNGARSDTEDNTITEGTHTDTVTANIDHAEHVNTDLNAYGAQSGSDSTQYGAKSESDSTQYGAKSATDTNQYGQHETTDAGTGHEEYELTRKGNIGVTTATQMLQQAWDAWHNVFNFYDVIFSDIARDLLRL